MFAVSNRRNLAEDSGQDFSALRREVEKDRQEEKDHLRDTRASYREPRVEGTFIFVYTANNWEAGRSERPRAMTAVG